MDQTQKLEAIEKLMGYTGLNQKKANDFLERSHWNVDSAYRMYKSDNMFQKSSGPPGPRTYAQPMPSMRRGDIGPHPVNFSEHAMFGSVMTGTGPAVGSNIHPALQPPQPVPKFPVERERIIPIQVESKQPLVKEGRSTPQTNTTWGNQPPYIISQNKPSKQESYSVQNRQQYQRPSYEQDDNTIVVKAGFLPSDKPFYRKEDKPPPLPQPKPQSQDEKKLSPPERPTLQGSASPKVLKRGLSRISQNASLVDEERKNLMHDIVEDCHDNMYVQTFVLPDISGYADDFREFLERDLIEMSTLVSLEQAGRLNWWADWGICKRLLPMATSGDGNCLLHAASLAMLGIHDRQLMLRKALYDTLTTKYYRDALYRRWRYQQTQANKEAGLIFSEEEWKKEWENVLHLASTTPRALPGTMHRNNSCCDSPLTQASSMSSKSENTKNNDSPVVYESLEEFHVFVLAHVIQRPIIVVADTILRDANGDAMAPIPFGGIYLPVECDPSHCYRSPLLLTYDAAHFSALVPMETSKDDDLSQLPVAIPIVSCELTTLPIHFAIDPGMHYKWEKPVGDFSRSEENKINLLKRYLDLEKLMITGACFDSNGDDRHSSGSFDSDDGKKKDNKLHSVSKQFGSFGKSVGKKLKNFGKGKDEKKSSGSKSSVLKNSKVSFTISSFSEMEQQSIWCCRIIKNASNTHQKMIDNYLYDAGERFKLEVGSPRLRRRDNVPSEARNSKTSQPLMTPCVTTGCHLYGTAETCYLCTKCFADQKKHVIDQEKDKHKSHHHHEENKDANGTKIGKSKFYDMTDSSANDKDRRLQQKPTVDVYSQPKESKGVSKTRQRTPSPDYDNVPFDKNVKHNNGANTMSTLPQKSPALKQRMSNHSDGYIGNKCRNPDCDFYGNAKTDNYCSGCYKTRKDLQLV